MNTASHGLPAEELEYVRFWARLGASLIDSLLVLFICAPLATAIYGEQYWTSDQFLHGPADLLITGCCPPSPSCCSGCIDRRRRGRW